MIDIDAVQADLEALVAHAIDSASTLEELIDVATAAAALGTPSLLTAVGERVAEQASSALASAGAWEAELAYSKVDAWSQTGHKARLLAEIWGTVVPGLREAGAGGRAPVKRSR
jgi:hypothetical protein